MFRKFLVKKDERAVLLYRGDFAGILGPGEHRYFDPLQRYAVEVFPLKAARFEHRFADYIVKAEPQLAAEHFHVIELGPTELALRYENGVLVELIAPNARRLYFKGYTNILHEVVDIAERFEVALRSRP